MTSPTPLTKEGFIEGFNKVWSSKEVWLAAQWLKEHPIEIADDIYSCVGCGQKGHLFSDLNLCRHCTINEAFGACRPEQKEVEP